MNNIPENYNDILDEAYEWVLKFNSDTPVTDDGIVALKEWSNRSPLHKDALKEAEDFWCEAELLSRLAVPANQAKRTGLSGFMRRFIGKSPFLSGASTATFNYWGSFATVLLFLGLSIVLVSSSILFKGLSGNGTYSTAVGEQKLLILHDASEVQLDTHSQVRVAYEDSTRQVYLLRGKAHFSVTKDPDRPFEVYAGEGLVRVVGTAFSVYLKDNGVEVVVGEGRVDLARVLPNTENHTFPDQTVHDVRVRPGQVFTSLERGQSAQFNRAKQELIQLSDKALSDKLAWRTGVLIFVRDPLIDVISEIGRYTNVKIEIVDPALHDLVMGGRFRVGELDALFEVLDISFDVQVSYLDEHHVQLRFKSNG